MRLLVFVISLVVPTLSLAQQAIEIETNRVAQHGYGDPSITFKPNVSGKLGVRAHQETMRRSSFGGWAWAPTSAQAPCA